MNTLPTIFTYEGNGLRTVTIDGELWWAARDVCKILALPNVSMAVNGNEKTGDIGLDDDEKGIRIIDTPGGNQSMLCVNESGLYHLTFKSRKAQAVKFRKWVTSEVLPSIRKTGSYAVNQEPLLQEVLGDILADSERLSKFIHHMQGIKDVLYPGTRKLITRKI